MQPMHIGNHTVTLGEKQIVDSFAFITMLGSLTNYLPHIAAIFTIVWTSIRIWETDTVKYVTGREQSNENNNKKE